MSKENSKRFEVNTTDSGRRDYNANFDQAMRNTFGKYADSLPERMAKVAREKIQALTFNTSRKLKELKQEVNLVLQTEVRLPLPSREKVKKLALPAAVIALTLLPFAGKAQATIEGPEDKAVAEEIKRGRMLVDGLKKDVEKIQEQYRDQQAQLAGQSTQPPAPAAEAPLWESNNNPQPPTAIPVPASVVAEENEVIQSNSNPEVDGTAQQNAVTQQIAQEENRAIEQNSTQAQQVQKPEVTTTQVSANLTGTMSRGQLNDLTERFMQGAVKPGTASFAKQPTLLQQIQGDKPQKSTFAAGDATINKNTGELNFKIPILSGGLVEAKSQGEYVIYKNNSSNEPTIVKLTAKQQEAASKLDKSTAKGYSEWLEIIADAIESQGGKLSDYPDLFSNHFSQKELTQGNNTKISVQEAIKQAKEIIIGNGENLLDFINNITQQINSTTSSAQYSSNMINPSGTARLGEFMSQDTNRETRLKVARLMQAIRDNATEFFRLAVSNPTDQESKSLLSFMHAASGVSTLSGGQTNFSFEGNHNLSTNLNQNTIESGKLSNFKLAVEYAEKVMDLAYRLGVDNRNQEDVKGLVEALKVAKATNNLSHFTEKYSPDAMKRVAAYLESFYELPNALKGGNGFTFFNQANKLAREWTAQQKANLSTQYKTVGAIISQPNVGYTFEFDYDQSGNITGFKWIKDSKGNNVDVGEAINKAQISGSFYLNGRRLALTSALGALGIGDGPQLEVGIQTSVSSTNSAREIGVSAKLQKRIQNIIKKYGDQKRDPRGMGNTLFELLSLLSDTGIVNNVPLFATTGESTLTTGKTPWTSMNPEAKKQALANLSGGDLEILVGLVEKVEKNPEFAKSIENLSQNPTATILGQLLTMGIDINGTDEHIKESYLARNGRPITEEQLQQAKQELATAKVIGHLNLRINYTRGVTDSSVPGVFEINKIYSQATGIITFDVDAISGGAMDLLAEGSGKKLTEEAKRKLEASWKQSIEEGMRTFKSGDVPNYALGRHLNQIVGAKAGDGHLRNIWNTVAGGNVQDAPKVIMINGYRVEMQKTTLEAEGLPEVGSQFFWNGVKAAFVPKNTEVIKTSITDKDNKVTTLFNIIACGGNLFVPLKNVEVQAPFSFSKLTEVENPVKNSFSSIPNLTGLGVSNQKFATLGHFAGGTHRLDTALQQQQKESSAQQLADLQNAMQVARFSLDGKTVVNQEEVKSRLSDKRLESYLDRIMNDFATRAQFENMKASSQILSFENSETNTSRLGGVFSPLSLFGNTNKTEVRQLTNQKAFKVGERVEKQGNNLVKVTTYKIPVSETATTGTTGPIGAFASSQDQIRTSVTTLNKFALNTPGQNPVKFNSIGGYDLEESARHLLGLNVKPQWKTTSGNNNIFETREVVPQTESVSDFQLGGKSFNVPTPPSQPVPTNIPTPGFQVGPDGRLIPVSPTPPSQPLPINPGQPGGVGFNPDALNPAPIPPSTPIPVTPGGSPSLPTNPGQIPTGPILPSAPVPTVPDINFAPVVPPTPTIPAPSSSFGLEGQSGASAPTINGNSSNLFNR